MTKIKELEERVDNLAKGGIFIALAVGLMFLIMFLITVVLKTNGLM